MSAERTKPQIRVLRHLARSGGTLICKCLGSMRDVVLLSEVHPRGVGLINPARQASEWFGLLSQADARSWKTRPPSFAQVLALVDQRAGDKGQTLIVRDWSHLDYVGVPFCRPEMGFATEAALAGVFDVRQFWTVRHPLDQFLSVARLPIMRGKLTMDRYLPGCVAAAEAAAAVGFVRYEDFTREPDAALASICAALAVDFDPGYADRWASYTTITGDTTGSRGGHAEIRPLQRRSVPDDVATAFRDREDYRRACELLGYRA